MSVDLHEYITELSIETNTSAVTMEFSLFHQHVDRCPDLKVGTHLIIWCAVAHFQK